MARGPASDGGSIGISGEVGASIGSLSSTVSFTFNPKIRGAKQSSRLLKYPADVWCVLRPSPSISSVKFSDHWELANHRVSHCPPYPPPILGGKPGNGTDDEGQMQTFGWKICGCIEQPCIRGTSASHLSFGM